MCEARGEIHVTGTRGPWCVGRGTLFWGGGYKLVVLGRSVQFSSVMPRVPDPAALRNPKLLKTLGVGACRREPSRTRPGAPYTSRVRRLSTVPRGRGTALPLAHSVLRMPPATDETRRYDMRYDAMNAPQKSFIVDVVRRFGGHRAYVLYTCEHNK